MTAVRRRAQAPFEGFARFKNVEEGDGVVHIEGLDKSEVDMGTDMMVLNASDLKLEDEELTRSFSNPMFNVQPPSNIYSAEPTEDLTFGVDNPAYIALNDVNMDTKDEKEKEGHYEIIDTDQLSEQAEMCDANKTESKETKLIDKGVHEENTVENVLKTEEAHNESEAIEKTGARVEEITADNELINIMQESDEVQESKDIIAREDVPENAETMKEIKTIDDSDLI